jgi:hypothetical protein
MVNVFFLCLRVGGAGREGLVVIPSPLPFFVLVQNGVCLLGWLDIIYLPLSSILLSYPPSFFFFF